MIDNKDHDVAINPVLTIKRFWKYLKRDKNKLIVINLLVIVSTITSVVAPLIMSIAIDEYIIKKSVIGLLWILVFLAFIYIVNAFLSWLTTFVMIKISESSLYRLRKDLFSHVEKLPLSFFDKHKKGDIMSRFTNDVSIISEALTDAIIQVISSSIMIVGVTIMMVIINSVLAITTIITVPFFFILVYQIGKKTKETFKNRQEKLGDINSYAEEMIGGMRVIKSYGKEQKLIDSFEIYNKELRNAATKAELYANLITPVNIAITNIGNILLICVGSILAVNGAATIGGILAFLNYSALFRRPINQLATLYASIQSALAGAERIFEMVDEPSETKDKINAVKLKEIGGHVKITDVNFSYIRGKKVLENLNLEVYPGENIAIVGPTGAGKTTIINLLSRFYEIDSGFIEIDGIDIRNIKKSSLRKKIGIVLQDTYLFKGSVIENIKYGNINATYNEVIEASKKAQAHSFIKRLPEGYNSLTEEEGSNFSQGERQLISIARAILANPEILILDEATSSVDTRTEQAIQKGMEKLMEGRTCFVIAHRLSTIREADEIIVLNNGKIIERGDHKELLRKRGFYHDLYLSQFDV